MRLGEIIERLSKEDKNLVLPWGFSNPHSYRGDYYLLGFEPIEDQRIGDALVVLTSAVDATYQGWKGGQYKMTVMTDCMFAEEGTANDSEEIGRRFLDLMIRHAHSL